MVPFVFETLHVLGLSMLIFVVLPVLDAIRGAMLISAVGIIPAIFSKFDSLDLLPSL
jgi:hypothetical protein